jgi:hypothetical protein
MAVSLVKHWFILVSKKERLYPAILMEREINIMNYRLGDIKIRHHKGHVKDLLQILNYMHISMAGGFQWQADPNVKRSLDR